RSQQPAIRAKGDGIDASGVALQGGQRPARLCLPEADCLILTAGRQGGAVGAERNGPDGVGVAARFPPFLVPFRGRHLCHHSRPLPPCPSCRTEQGFYVASPHRWPPDGLTTSSNGGGTARRAPGRYFSG